MIIAQARLRRRNGDMIIHIGSLTGIFVDLIMRVVMVLGLGRLRPA